MRLIKRFLLLLIMLFFVCSNVYSAEVIRTLIHSDFGSNQWNNQRLDITSGGRLYVVYASNGSITQSIYSDDSGSNWTADSADPFAATQYYHPSLWIDSDTNTLLVTASNPASLNLPKFDKRNGAWAGDENVSDNEPVTYSQILVDSGGVEWCVFEYNAAAISAAVRTGGTWQANVDNDLDGTNTCASISARMDANDNLHVVWREDGDPNYYYIKTAYFDGSSWSADTTIDTFLLAQVGQGPTMNKVGDTLIILWSRSGVGTNTGYDQIRWSYGTGDSWTSVANVTDVAQNHHSMNVVGGYGTNYYLVYGGDEVDPNNSGIWNTAYRYYDGASWSNETALTYEPTIQLPTSIAEEGNTIHMLITEYGEDKEYHASFDTTGIGPNIIPQLLIIQAQ